MLGSKSSHHWRSLVGLTGTPGGGSHAHSPVFRFAYMCSPLRGSTISTHSSPSRRPPASPTGLQSQLPSIPSFTNCATNGRSLRQSRSPLRPRKRQQSIWQEAESGPLRRTEEFPQLGFPLIHPGREEHVLLRKCRA